MTDRISVGLYTTIPVKNIGAYLPENVGQLLYWEADPSFNYIHEYLRASQTSAVRAVFWDEKGSVLESLSRSIRPKAMRIIILRSEGDAPYTREEIVRCEEMGNECVEIIVDSEHRSHLRCLIGGKEKRSPYVKKVSSGWY